MTGQARFEAKRTWTRSVAGVRERCRTECASVCTPTPSEAARPCELRRSRQFLERDLGLQRFRLGREGLRAEDLQRSERAREARSLARDVRFEARIDVERDAGVGSSVLASEEVEPPRPTNLRSEEHTSELQS